MWSFSEVIDGMAEVCKELNTPVVSGNVSFYNETEGRGILPTPVVGMVGLVEDVKRVVQVGFKNAGDVIALLGTTKDDLSISEYAATVQSMSTEQMIRGGRVPELDLALELAAQATCLEAAESGLLESAHDCSDGGLAVALAESCFSSLGRLGIGAEVDFTDRLPAIAMLFSETPSRIIITFSSDSTAAVQRIAQSHNCPMQVIGRVGGDSLRISLHGQILVDSAVAVLEEAWRTALPKKLQAEAMAAGKE
jgi:phosphoribosylformylglycinamidine synthase